MSLEPFEWGIILNFQCLVFLFYWLRGSFKEIRYPTTIIHLSYMSSCNCFHQQMLEEHSYWYVKLACLPRNQIQDCFHSLGLG